MNDATPTVLGPECVLKGDLQLRGPCRILGTFEGAIRGATEIHIGAGGVCTATLEADRVFIDGSHTGDIVAREKLQLGPKAQVRGDVVAGAFSVAEGAVFAGRVGVSADPRPLEPSSTPASMPEIKIVAAKAPVKVDWNAEPSAADWLNQPLKSPSWMKDVAGAD
ncbi:MAG: hypothetical protein HBSAPP03_08800 [Phycisphaerae bacterium]|nr:MAG: hypothetical protein HBSAPP03_08800 [Phycisphaerae bacterium]